MPTLTYETPLTPQRIHRLAAILTFLWATVALCAGLTLLVFLFIAAYTHDSTTDLDALAVGATFTLTGIFLFYRAFQLHRANPKAPPSAARAIYLTGLLMFPLSPFAIKLAFFPDYSGPPMPPPPIELPTACLLADALIATAMLLTYLILRRAVRPPVHGPPDHGPNH